jgi:hypothetical protein
MVHSSTLLLITLQARNDHTPDQHAHHHPPLVTHHGCARPGPHDNGDDSEFISEVWQMTANTPWPPICHAPYHGMVHV